MTVGMYAPWWNKPLNVRCPTQVILRRTAPHAKKSDVGEAVDDFSGPAVATSTPIMLSKEGMEHVLSRN